MPKITFQKRADDADPPHPSSAWVAVKEVDVPTGTSILDAAFACGVLVPTRCGGIASCQACKVFIPPPYALSLSSVAAAEARSLSAHDAQDGWRLACQAKVFADAVVELAPAKLEPGP